MSRGDVEFTMAADFRPFDRALTRHESVTRRALNRIALAWQRSQGFAGKQAERRARQSAREWGRAGKRIAGAGAVAGVGIAAGMLVASKAIRAASEDSPRLKRQLEDISSAQHEFMASMGRDIASGVGLEYWDGLISGANKYRDASAEAVAQVFESGGKTDARHRAEAGERAMDRRIAGQREFERISRSLTQQEGAAFNTETARDRARRSAVQGRYQDTLRQIAAQKNLNAEMVEEARARARGVRDAEIRGIPSGVGRNRVANEAYYRSQGVSEAQDRYQLSGKAEDQKRLVAARTEDEKFRVVQQIRGRTDLNDKQKLRHIEDEKNRIMRRYEVELQLIDKKQAKEKVDEQRRATTQREDLRVESLRLRGRGAEADREQIRLDTLRRIRDIKNETGTSDESRQARIRQLRENETLGIARVGQSASSTRVLSGVGGIPLAQLLGKAPNTQQADAEEQKKHTALLGRLYEGVSSIDYAMAHIAQVTG